MHRPKSDERTFYYEIHEGREDSLCERISEERNGVPSPLSTEGNETLLNLMPANGEDGADKARHRRSAFGPGVAVPP